MPFLFWWISLNLRQRGSQILSNNPGPKMLLKCSMRTCATQRFVFGLNNKSDHNAISITSVHDPWFHRFGPNIIWTYRLSPQLFGGRGRRSGHTNQRLKPNGIYAPRSKPAPRNNTLFGTFSCRMMGKPLVMERCDDCVPGFPSRIFPPPPQTLTNLIFNWYPFENTLKWRSHFRVLPP